MRKTSHVNLLLLRSILVSYILPRSEETDILEHRKTRIEQQNIINGIPVDQGVYPFVVSITRYDSVNDRFELLGTGTIVSDHSVVTACQCVGKVVENGVELYLAHWIIVTAGSLYVFDTSRGNGQESNGKRVIPHPKCSSALGNKTRYDCAVVELATPFTFNKYVQPLEWYSKSEVGMSVQIDGLVSQEAVCSVPGWGSTLETETSPARGLLETKVRLVSLDSCRRALCVIDESYCPQTIDWGSQVCTMPYLSSPCRFDQGSPLICNGLVYAQMSWNLGCRPDYPTIFVRPEVMLQTIGYKPEERKISHKTKSLAFEDRPHSAIELLALLLLVVIVRIYE